MTTLRNGNRCSVPTCENHSSVNRDISFYAPRDEPTKRDWRAAIVSHRPLSPVRNGKERAISHVCSAHFAEDAYEEADVLKSRLGLRPKRMRLKAGAVPTIFEERLTDDDCRDKTERISFEVGVSPILIRGVRIVYVFIYFCFVFSSLRPRRSQN